MRITKFLSAVCAAAFLTGSHAIRAQDTPAQAAARAALMQKMTELDAQQIQPTNSNPLASVVILPSAGQEQAVQPAIAAPATPPPVVPPPATPEAAPVVKPSPPVIVVTPSGAQTVSQQQAPGSDRNRLSNHPPSLSNRLPRLLSNRRPPNLSNHPSRPLSNRRPPSLSNRKPRPLPNRRRRPMRVTPERRWA